MLEEGPYFLLIVENGAPMNYKMIFELNSAVLENVMACWYQIRKYWEPQRYFMCG